MGIFASKPSSPKNLHLEIRSNDDLASQRHNLVNITSITIHEGVTIKRYEFVGCSGLTSLVIHQGVKISPSAFLGCTGLASLVIYQGVNIEAHAFSGCTGLTSLVIPQGVTIRWFAFKGCRSLASLVTHQSVTIGNEAFKDCTGLTLVYVICNPEQEVGWRAQNIQGQFDLNVRFQFIPERFINGIINRIKLHLPGLCLERLVIPGNLGEALESPTNTQSNNNIPLGLPASRKLLYNNHLARQQQRRQIQPHLKALLLVGIRQAHAKIGAQVPQEIWNLILSFVFYQALEPDDFYMLMKSLFTPGHVRRDENGISFLAIKP